MGGTIDPVTGNLCGHAVDHIRLTDAQRTFAKDRSSWRLASAIQRFTNEPGGGFWFSKYSLGLSATSFAATYRGQELGLWDKDPAKDYWKHNRLTWPWVMTALAMQNEWDKSPEAQALRESITRPLR